MKNRISQIISESIDVKNKMLSDFNLLEIINCITQEIYNGFKNNKKLLLCGNGGSASDSQHIASEFSGKFYIDRKPLFAESLCVNTSYLTSVSNDYSFDNIFERLVECKGGPGDIIIGISTSGNSINVLNAIKKASELGMVTIGFTGMDGGKMNDICEYLIKVPSKVTPRIQEAHITIGHIICELVEEKLFR